MADNSFTDKDASTPIYAAWLTDINAVVYRLLGNSSGVGGTGGAPAARSDILTNLNLLTNAQGNVIPYATTSGPANAQTATFSPRITSMQDGMIVQLKNLAGTNTGALTLQLDNSLAVYPVVGLGGNPLQGGEFPAYGVANIMYSAYYGKLVLLYCAPAPLQVATGTQSGHAVNLGQLASVAPVGNYAASSTATSVSATTGTLTAPCKGNAYVLATGGANPLSGTTLSCTASLAGLVVTTSQGNYAPFAFGELPMAKGDSSTFSASVTNTNSGVSVNVAAFFIPTP